MSRVTINPRKPERKVFMSIHRKVTICGKVVDLYGLDDRDIIKSLVTPSNGLSRSEYLLLAEEMDRRKDLRESAWGNI